MFAKMDLAVFLCIAGQVYDFDVPCTDSAIALSRSALARISQHASCKIVGRNLYIIYRSVLQHAGNRPSMISRLLSHLKHVPWSNFGFSLPMLGIVINP